MEKLKSFLDRHAENLIVRILRKTLRIGNNVYKDIQAAFYLLRWRRRGVKNRAVRVCFVQQDPNCWNKSKALYDLLKHDKRFCVSLVCVPDPFDPDTESTYRYFLENGYDNAIDARVGAGPWLVMEGTGEWFDLKELKPDYLFYQQPYNAYLPEAYRSHVVSRYTRICHTPYGFALTKELLRCMERDFCRYVFRTYSVSELERRYNCLQFPITSALGLRKARYYSPLVFADFFQEQQKQSNSWQFSKNTFRAIWTPRWTTNETLGGSNFFRYKDFLLQYAQEHPDVDMLFRPHPMAFDNFIRTGLMTRTEVDAYIAACNAHSNTSIDAEKKYGATLWQSSVLITDVSAIIVEYFATGKPIIFCPTKHCVSTYLSHFNAICECCYVANNQEEIAGYLRLLQRGEDPMAGKRQIVIKDLFGDEPMHAPEKIREDLLQSLI